MPRPTPLDPSTGQPSARRGVLPWLGTLLLPLTLTPAALAASPLLETVKQNPALSRQMCATFKQLNAEGRSAMSQESIAAVASAQGLSPMDAEVLITYVIGLNCPDVR